jgi:hypothetical protein
MNEDEGKIHQEGSGGGVFEDNTMVYGEGTPYHGI